VTIQNFSSPGKYGDTVWSLPIIRHLVGAGGGKLHMFPKWSHFHVDVAVTEMIAPLLRLQPYITDVEFSPICKGIDLGHYWLTKGIVPGWNIVDHLCEAFNVPRTVQDAAWITVDPTKKIKYVFSRTAAEFCHNPNMPWRQIVERYGKEACFIGWGSEYFDFVHKFDPGQVVPYYRTRDFLHAAKVIAGAEKLFCNQSAIHAIGEAMKVPLLLEVCPKLPSVVFDRPRAYYAWTKRFDVDVDWDSQVQTWRTLV